MYLQGQCRAADNVRYNGYLFGVCNNVGLALLSCVVVHTYALGRRIQQPHRRGCDCITCPRALARRLLGFTVMLMRGTGDSVSLWGTAELNLPKRVVRSGNRTVG